MINDKMVDFSFLVINDMESVFMLPNDMQRLTCHLCAALSVLLYIVQLARVQALKNNNNVVLSSIAYK